jgi:hypothetical protein
LLKNGAAKHHSLTPHKTKKLNECSFTAAL